MKTIALHESGRIGWHFLRISLQHNPYGPVCISGIRDATTLATLFAVDTNFLVERG